ncbi:MAG TPA: metallophosphoesterase [Gaiellaceae bacterium]|nr:metallophosphoesterase [Gaiellaceae bacterium]
MGTEAPSTTPTRILHVSDLHVGAREDASVGHELVELVERTAPELVIASGDLTHRGRRTEHERAARALGGLDVPVLAVPGNHDIPYTFPARFTSPWREFERQWTTTEPIHASAGLHVVGVNSVRPWRHQSGGVGDDRLARVAERLAAAEPGALRVVALHHQLIGAPWRTRKRPVARRTHVLARLVDCGAELIVGGHIHQCAVSERHEFEVLDAGAASAVVSIAPGLGQPRPRRRGEARGCVVYVADERSLDVESWIRGGDGWAVVARRRFPRPGARFRDGA